MVLRTLAVEEGSPDASEDAAVVPRHHDIYRLPFGHVITCTRRRVEGM